MRFLTEAPFQRTGTGRRRRVEPDATLRLEAVIEGAGAQFAVDGEPFGPVLDMGILSDDYGDRLRFTGSFAAIYAVDAVDFAFTADFKGLTVRAF